MGEVYGDLPDFANELEDDTLIEALNHSGGGGKIGMTRNLLRAAVAAILNAEHPEVDYLGSPRISSLT